MTRVTSTLVLAVLLGTVGVRVGCAWSCQPSPVNAAAGHCHETPVAAFEFSAAAGCNDVRSGAPFLVATVRPDAASLASVDRLASFSLAADDVARSRPAAARPIHAAPPPAFAIPLRE